MSRKSLQVERLRGRDAQWAREAYARLYARAMPHAGRLALERIELVDYGLATTAAKFRRTGLGIEVVVVYRDPDGSGHTGKVLMNLPGQLLLEHAHVDTYVLKGTARVPAGFVRIKELINGFEGIRRYHADGTPVRLHGRVQYVYPDGPYCIVQARDGARPLPPAAQRELVAVYPGKSETFKAIYGDGVLLADTAVVVHALPGVDPHRVPAGLRARLQRVRREQIITTRREIYMARGTIVLLPKGTKHAFLAGKRGAVYLEFSTPSMDEADRFTDPRVVR